VAIRRTTRVGAHAGELLEDLGVTADTTHDTTDRDLLHDNTDLLKAAACRASDFVAGLLGQS